MTYVISCFMCMATLIDDVYATVLAVAFFILTISHRLFGAETYDLDAPAVRAGEFQRAFDRLSASRAEGKVVLPAAALVAITLDFKFHARASLQIGGVLQQEAVVVFRDGGLVIVEKNAARIGPRRWGQSFSNCGGAALLPGWKCDYVVVPVGGR